MYWDPMYFVFGLPALLLAMYAQWRVRSAYRKYFQVPNALRITGGDAAQRLLRSAGLPVRIERVSGKLTDHYDPRNNVLRISPDVERSASVGAVAIVAHEIGHAMQDAHAFALLRLRSGLVPAVNFTSHLGPILFLVGMLFNFRPLAMAGVLCFAAAAVFALVTLPVELDASRRAMQLLQQNSILVDDRSIRGARQMLSAAALTYVAALAQTLSTLLYYLSILNGGRRRRR